MKTLKLAPVIFAVFFIIAFVIHYVAYGFGADHKNYDLILYFIIACALTFIWDKWDTAKINKKTINEKKEKGYFATKGSDYIKAEQPEKININLKQKRTSRASCKKLLATYLGGSGYSFEPNGTYCLFCLDDSLIISHINSDNEFELPFKNINAAEISGSGTETSNANLTGGGFGLEGALTGILTAAIINAATTKSKTNTFLRIETSDAEVIFHFNNIEPGALRLDFSALFVSVNGREKSVRTNFGLAEEINKLQALKENGVLNEEEFLIAKKKLLENK